MTGPSTLFFLHLGKSGISFHQLQPVTNRWLVNNTDCVLGWSGAGEMGDVNCLYVDYFFWIVTLWYYIVHILST